MIVRRNGGVLRFFGALSCAHRGLAEVKAPVSKTLKAGDPPARCAVGAARAACRADDHTDAPATAGDRQLGIVGERPPSPFGGVPVSEIAIFAGLVAIVVWLIGGALPVLVVGLR